MTADNSKIKREIEIKEFVCPFCEHKELLKVDDRFFDAETNQSATYGIDYWECPDCGEENDIGLELFEKDFKVFKKYTEKHDWNGLINLCTNNKFDDFILFSLANYYIQKQQFEKSLNIAKILVEINPNDICSEELIEKSIKGLDFIKNKNKQ